MADGQSFQSFSDFDQFLKKKPEVSPEKQTQQPSGGFSDFASFDNFLKGSKEPKKPPEKPPKWGEVFSLSRPTKLIGYRGQATPEQMVQSLKGEFGLTVDQKDPNLTKIWRNAYANVDPINHPLNFLTHTVEAGLRDIHEAGVSFMEDLLPPGGAPEVMEKEAKILSASLKDPSFTKDPKRKASAERDLQFIKDGLAQLHKEEMQHPKETHIYDPEVILRGAGESIIDWESMGALFKPMEWAGEAVKDVKAARHGMYVINQALGADFSYDSFKESEKKFKEGDYWGSLRELGNAGALLVLPLFHHVMSEKGITQDQIRQKANEVLEEKKKELQVAQQARPNAVLPITPQAIEDMQYRIANGLPMMGIGRPKPADINLARDLTTDPLKLAEKNLQNRREREDARSAAQSRVVELERQYREELEEQWVDDRRKRYLDMLQEEEEQRRRSGEDLQVVDRRRFAFTPLPEAPAAAVPPTPPPEPAVAPAAAAASMAPTPQTREGIQDKINASAWRNLELERKKATVTNPEDIRLIDDEMERNRQLAGDLAMDRIAEAMEGRKKPKTVKAGEALTGPVGKPGELKTVTRNYPIRYRVVEGASLRPSHDPMTFEKVSGYPEGVQERNYDTDKDAQVAVIQHTQDYDPNFTLSDAPGPEHGPPMVTGDGVVLGGNSRAMSTMRLYREGNGDAYRDALLAKASQLGLDPADIKDMKEPVLVRELISAPTDVQSLRALGSDLNKVFTRKLSEYEQAVSAGKRLTQDTLDYILNQLQELGEGATIRDLLRERSRGILEKLEADGVIASTERRAFVDEKTNTLNDTGKDFIENAILGSVVDDPLVLANSPKSILRKIERSLSDLAKIKARGGAWDITDYLKEALREHISAASKGVSIEDHINPPTAALFPREPIHPIVEGIARKLEEGSAAAKKAFEQFSNDAEMDVKGQGTMAFFKPPVPWESFSQHFGVDVKPQEWGTIKASTTTSRTHPATGASVARPLGETPVASKPKSIIEEEFEKEVARIKAEEPPERFDVGEIQTEPKTGRPSEIFREEAEKAFPNIKKDQMDAIMAITEARAKATGKTLDDWIQSKRFSFESQKGGIEAKIRETEKGIKLSVSRTKAQVEFLMDKNGINTIIRAFEAADVSALAHELGHVFRRDLYEHGGLSHRQWMDLEDWAGVRRTPERGTIWTIHAEEKFARGFERYLREGKAPTEGLRGVFEKFKAWMTEIYRAIRKSPIDVNISPEVKDIFDRMLTPRDLEPTPEKGPEPLAPTPEGEMVTLYRGEASPSETKTPPDWVLQGLKESGALDAQGRWFTDDPKIAEWYRNEVGEEKGRITTVQVPRNKLEEFRVQGRKELERFSLDPAREFFLPSDLAKTAKRREIEIPEPGPKKRSEFTEAPQRDLRAQIRAMTDEDLRSAAKTIQNNMEREITPHAKQFLESEFKPIKEEMDRRKLLDRPERGFGESNAIFTKARADSARERLRKKLGTTFYAGIDPELVRDVSEIMGYYFEGGIREFGSLARKVISEFGESVRPALREAYETMLQRGRIESKEPQQRDSFKPVMEIILPPGVEEEVRRGKAEEREARPPSVPPRERTDVGARAPEREAARQAPREATRPTGSTREPAPGRAGRPVGATVGGGGVVEQFGQPLRNVSTPRVDVEHITDIPHSVEATEWKRRLKDANLPENLPPPTETLSPATDAKLAFKGQPEIVQTVLTSLRKYHGAILATSTGTGKTYMGSAILAEKRPRYGLIITPSQNIAKQWIDTAELFGVEIKPLEKDIPTEPGIYTTTYSTATNRKGLSDMPWNMVIADESHYARRWHDPGNKRGKFLIDLSKNSEDVLYASATPFHTPLELGYFDKLGLWKKTGLETWLKNEFGIRQGEGGKWVVPMNYRKLAALRDELINRGMFVNLDRQMEGYGANFAVVPMNEGTMQGVRDATQAFRLAEEYFRRKNAQKMIMAVRGNAATFMKSYLERQRLPEAIELGKKLEKEGWKVIYFTESKKEVDEIYDFLKPADEAYDGEISRKLPRLPNVVDTLKEAFGENLADFTGAHSARRQQDLDDFNRGGKRHLIATYGAGGVGVSLHDLSGEAPRAVVYLGPPWSGVMFDQAVGRPWRFGTKSNVAAYFLTSNAQPEMKLIFQKVLPRFESLKASVSGIKKTDPIVSAMKDLDAFLAYEFGNDTAVGFDQFMATVPTNAISSYKEASVVSAETAKNKGMRVERRDLPMEPTPGGPTTLKQQEFVPPPKDLRRPEDVFTEKDEKSAETIRRPFVSDQTERDIADPRMLDQINDQNMSDLGISGGGEKPPGPPSETVGNQQIPRPGEAEVRREDLAAPKIMQRVYDFAEKHFGEWGVPVGMIDRLAKAESGVRVWLAQMHTSPYVLRQFPETKVIADGITNAERVYRADLSNMQYEKTKIFQENGLINDPIGRRKVDQALRMTDQGVPLSSLLGQTSKWLDGSEFKANELKAAQRIRDEIYEPVIEAVRDVRPDVGYRRKYSAVIRTMEDLVSTLHPELGGKVPADLIPYFSLEVRRAMTKDPFSPHALKRRGEPPKTFDIDEVLEAYLPGMLKVKHYTKLSRKVAAQLAELPDSTLKEYATKYSRIFFGVPSEYKRMDRFRYSLSKTITDLSYASALEANPLWFTMHLTKVPVNTLPELGRNGATYLAKGYERMMTEEGREIVARSGVLMDRLWVFPETFFELKKRPRNWLRLTTSMSDAIDRSSSYLAALEKAKDMGFLGPKEEVGEITWKRLNELSANGVDTSKAFDYANSVMARSEFLYTPGYVQMWQREHPVLGMFKHYIFREAEFFSTLRKIAKEVKSQPDPEAYIEKQVSLGNYEYIDAVAKYRRFLVSLTGAAAVAAGIGGPLFSRFWPFHMSRLLSAPVIFGAETMDLVRNTISGNATEDQWKRWVLDLFGSFTPYAGFAVRTIEQESKLPRYETGFQGRRRRLYEEFEPTPVEQFQFEPLPK